MNRHSRLVAVHRPSLLQASQPARSLPVLARICREHGSATEAAMNGELTAEEYLLATENLE